MVNNSTENNTGASDFRTSGYFSWNMMFLGVFLIFIGLFVFVKTIIVALIIFLISTTIFTTHYRLKVDFKSKVFFDYLWILGIKHGDKGKFERIEYLFIKKSKVSQKMNHLVGSATIRKEVYNGYLKFSEEDIIHLTAKDNKKDLIQKLNGISAKLKVNIYDYSDGDPKEL